MRQGRPTRASASRRKNTDLKTGSSAPSSEGVPIEAAIGSQVVDNLNATTHVRTLLTDLFLLDEAAKISGI